MKNPRVLAISGGIGGAKLALGLSSILPPGALFIAVNVGDDFEHLGLSISPDIDTMLYTLAGIADASNGWGRADETWNCITQIERLGGDSWFRLGDKDLAVHIERSYRLARGESLTSITQHFARRLGIESHIYPATDERVRTVVDSDVGTLEFQDYFVRRRCAPAVEAIRYVGASDARPSSRILELLAGDELSAVVICPSNPYLSVDPLLAMPQFAAALRKTRAPVIAVSPLIGAAAVKGPTAKIMQELGLEVTSVAIGRHYADYIDGLVLDPIDASLVGALDVPAHLTPTLMMSLEVKRELARQVLRFAAACR